MESLKNLANYTRLDDMGDYQARVYSECDSIPEIKANVYGLHKGKRESLNTLNSKSQGI